MTTATLDLELDTPVIPPGHEDQEVTSETASAPIEGLPDTVTAEVGAWPASAPEAEQEITSETASVAPAEEAAPEEALAPDEAATVRVLVVDDETAMCAMTGAIIESMGFVPIIASSGEEAIETYRDHAARDETIQAVIMDLALPGGMSGLEATDALHEIDEEIRVIATSGYLQQNARTAAIERGFAGILPKPYTAERLTAELRWVVTRR